MRLSFALPAAAGLLLGWAAIAHADAPPAAPIFYCPAPEKAAAAAAPATAPAHSAHVIHAGVHHRHGCPTLRVAAEHHRHWRDHEHGPRVLAGNDVSASQAFIYRYERAVHGLDARAAEEAWAEGRRPPCPHDHGDHCPGAWRHDGPPIEGPVLAQRELPPPPCPHNCPPPLGWGHDGRADNHAFTERAPAPVEARPLPEPPRLVLRAPPPAELPPAAPRPSAHSYAWQDGDSGYRRDRRAEESERAGGWSYSEQDGHGQYRHWGDHFAGEPGWDGDADGHRADGRGERHWVEGRYRCPPPVPASACGAGPDAPVRHSDVAVAGRDAAGYLTWPGKTE